MRTFRLFPHVRAGAPALGVVAAIAFAFAPSGTLAQTPTVIVNGQTMTFQQQPPIIQAGRVFVPMRAIFQQLGASVVYSNGQINATSHRRTISLTIGSTHATIDGQPETLDVAPFIVNQSTLVPLRFVAQALGASVNWNDNTSTVVIRSGGGAPAAPPPPAPMVNFTTYWPSGTVYNHYPQIRFQIDRHTRLGLFTVTLDGRDITPAFQSNGEFFFARSPFSLEIGTHRVRVAGRTAGGISFGRSWTFYQGTP